MSSHRKKPFSAKQKKKQLYDKREKKRDDIEQTSARNRKEMNGEDSDGEDVTRINQQPINSSDVKKGYDPNRYRLHFMAESRKEIDKRKKLATVPYTMLPESCLEMTVEEIYADEDERLDIPKRPSWDYKLSREALDAREEKYFKEYVDKLLSSSQGSVDKLSYFEVNLQTWRQLWRVLEMSDIVLVICDIRFPALHFCPALYEHVTHDLRKRVILVLNKIDLVAPSIVVAWKHYLAGRYPDVRIVCFTSFPKDFSEVEEKRGLQSKKTRKRFDAVGTLELVQACEAVIDNKVNLSSWREKVDEDARTCPLDEDAGIITEQDADVADMLRGADYEAYQHCKDGILTIGCVGYPNVGKSSLLNGLVGKKVVSISKTPGHTKHFQTIFLTPTVRLCDCPGLVFPSYVPRPLQILAGIFPVAQVREPYTAVEYLARRIEDLPGLLDIRHPDDESAVHEERRRVFAWSPMDICYAWADKRGFTTAKIGRPDAHRAANHLLRLSLESRLCLASRPPGYTANKDFWTKHEETVEMMLLQSASFVRDRQVAPSASDDYQSSQTSAEDDDTLRRGDNDEQSEETGSSPLPAANSDRSKLKTHNPFLLLGSNSDDELP